MVYANLEINKAQMKNRTAMCRTLTLVEKCELRNRWRGETCREAWPVSRFAWCFECLLVKGDTERAYERLKAVK